MCGELGVDDWYAATCALLNNYRLFHCYNIMYFGMDFGVRGNIYVNDAFFVDIYQNLFLLSDNKKLTFSDEFSHDLAPTSTKYGNVIILVMAKL